LVSWSVGQIKLSVTRYFLQQQYTKILIFSLLSVTITLFAIFLSTGWLTRKFLHSPIRSLTEISKTIAGGNYKIDVTQHSVEEFTPFIQALGSMANRIEQQVDELKQSRNELQQAELKYRKIVENAVEGLFQVELDGRLISYNKAFANILGFDINSTEFDANKFRQINVLEKFLFASTNQWYEQLLNFEQRGDIPSWEVNGLTQDNKKFYAILTLRRLNETSTNKIYLEGSLVDITARKEKEEAQEEKAAAEAASQTKSLFLANMSHEIRTPLNAVMGFLQLCLKTELNEKQRDHLYRANSAAKSLLGIINDILDFSKVEAGKLELENIEFDLEKLLEDVINVIGLKVESKGIDLVVSVTPEVPRTLLGDPLRLIQVIINLCSNAVKFTENGKVEIEIRFLEKANTPQVSLLLFIIKDSGIGMTDDQLRKLFNAFQQADSSTTRKHGGTGLGLAICKRLIELMGGKIDVESNLGSGSKFEFSIAFQQIGYEMMPPKDHVKIDLHHVQPDSDITSHAPYKISSTLKEGGIISYPIC